MSMVADQEQVVKKKNVNQACMSPRMELNSTRKNQMYTPKQAQILTALRLKHIPFELIAVTKIVDLTLNLISGWDSDQEQREKSSKAETLMMNRNKVETLNLGLIELKFPCLVRLELRSNMIAHIQA